MKKLWDFGKNRYISLFTKSVVILITIGMLPLLVMGFSIYSAYQDSVRETILSNMYRTTLSIGQGMEDMLEEMDENTRYLYSYQITDVGYLYDMLEDETLGDSKKNVMLTNVLKNILYQNQYIDRIFFVLPDGNYSSVMRLPETMVRPELLKKWHEENFTPGNRKMQLLSIHEADYAGADSLNFTVYRNIMNTRTIQSAREEIMGTLYLDVDKACLDSIINETNVGNEGQFAILDRSDNTVFYSTTENQGEIKEIEKYGKQLDEKSQYIQAGNEYYIYSQVPGTSWSVIEKISASSLESSYQTIRNTTLLVIGLGVILLMILYYVYSKKTSQPIRNLKEAMEKIEGGNLDTRVEIASNDEIGYLAKGLNSMTEKLQGHIQKVYIAEIRQRDAEIETLKSQIQPHYLYNTLDVIRMTAITNDDKETAEMLDGLSGQLKYTIGSAREMVSLQAEIESVRNYFKIIRVRYENRFTLEVNVPGELLRLEVPQLILQPVVENALKHGLRPKEYEKGVVAIQGELRDGRLEIAVMDNGVGMTGERLKQVQELLEAKETVKHANSKRASIGIKNVSDRIKLIFGEEYSLTITSIEHVGTIVNYSLPVIRLSDEERTTSGRRRKCLK